VSRPRRQHCHAANDPGLKGVESPGSPLEGDGACKGGQAPTARALSVRPRPGGNCPKGQWALASPGANKRCGGCERCLFIFQVGGGGPGSGADKCREARG